MKCLRRFRRRQGRCYELAGRAMLNEAGADAFTLVHGEIHQLGEVLAHAWIELPCGEIYDPALNEYMSRGEYDLRFQPAKQRRYDLHQAAQFISLHGHYGPWE